MPSRDLPATRVPVADSDDASFRAHYEATPAMLHSIDESGRIVLVSDHWLRVLCYDRSEVIGHRSTEFLTAESRRYAEEVVLPGFFRTGSCWDVPYEFVRKDGEIVDVLLSATSEQDGEGAVLRSRAVLIDVTERKRAEAALERSESNLAEAQRIAAVGSLEWVEGGSPMWWSAELFRILGLEPGSTRPSLSRLLESVEEQDRPRIERLVRTVREEGREIELECRIVRPDGSHRTVHGRVAIGSSQEDGARRIACTLQDVSERRALEHQLAQSQKLEAVGLLAGGVAHDFNNILQSIYSNADFAMEGLAVDDPRRLDLEFLLESADRASSLVRKLLAFARPQPLQLDVIRLDDLISGLLGMLERVIGEDVRVTLASDPELWLVEVDPVQLEQVVVNLCLNARDAMPRGGEIGIEVGNVALERAPDPDHAPLEAGQFVLLSVSDTGHGMDAATRERIFEPFFTTKAPGLGSGLGLTTAYGIVRHHRGAIDAESSPGAGTRFRIYLPRFVGERSDRRTDAPVRPATGHGVVLVAEDDPAVRRVMVKVLERAGYEVVEAEDGEEALAHFHQTPRRFDLALLDVVMPKIGGDAVWQAMQSLRPDLPVLFASGYESELARIRVGQRGEPIPLLHKPFPAAELIRRVGELIAGAG